MENELGQFNLILFLMLANFSISCIISCIIDNNEKSKKEKGILSLANIEALKSILFFLKR